MSEKTRKVSKAFVRHKGKKPLMPKLKLFRSNEPLLSVFMWGVNHSIMELSHVPPPGLLMPDDFRSFSKIKVENRSFNKDNMPSHYKFKEYCPNVFRNLRERFGIDEKEYLRSLTFSEPEAGDSAGRSGAKFYNSCDKKFVVKSLCAEEVAEIHTILKPYHEYIVEKHARTLLQQMLGMYRLTVEGAETYLVVIRNILGRKYPVHKKYDLKGSTVQRQASEKEKAKELPTFKDNDFKGCKLFLPQDAKDKLHEMLVADTEFLAAHKMMDYSLLIGIHDCDKAAEEQAEAAAQEPAAGGGRLESTSEASGGEEFEVPTPPDSPIPSTGAFAPLPTDGAIDLAGEFYAIPCAPDAPKRELYFVGLVDILTHYGVKKKTASAAKTVKYGADADNISTVKPEQYARRLLDFLTLALELTPTAPAAPAPAPQEG